MTGRPAIRCALLAVVLVAMSAQATLAQESPPPSGEAPTGEAASSEVPVGAGAAGADGSVVALADVERGQVLAPGRYVDRSLGRDLTFELGDGWVNDGAIEGAGFAIVRDEPGSPYFAISPFPGQVFPEGCVADGQDPEAFFEAVTDIDTTAASFIDHIASHAAITAAEPVPVELAGFSGLQLDVSAVDVDDTCMPPWAWLWLLPVVGDYHLNEGETARILALDAGGQVVVAIAEAFPDADDEAFLAEAMSVLESLQIGPLAD
jgi:hypothetical protein